MSTGEVAKKQKVHRTTVWHWIKSGMLKSTPVTPRFRGVSDADLAAFRATFVSDSDVTEPKKASVSRKPKPRSKPKKKAAKKAV